MISTLIAIHVVLLSLSIVATTGSAITAAFGVYVSRLFNTINVVITSTGLLLGAFLLLDKPLDMHCVTLTAYVATFALAQVYIRRRNRVLATETI